MEKLFRGVAVIFDDEIDKSSSNIFAIKKSIEENNIPVATYKDLPRKELIPSLANASFIILDWDFSSSSLETGTERVLLGSELEKSLVRDLIAFIEEALQKIFVPVFIFSYHSEDSIIEMLEGTKVLDEENENRVFIKQKNSIQTSEQLFKEIEAWLKQSPSVYVLKEWEKVLLASKNEMFFEFNSYSSSWVYIIWRMLSKDSVDYSHEFGRFLTRSLNNRIQEYNFDENFILASSDTTEEDIDTAQGTNSEVNQEEIVKVLQGERYISFSKDDVATQPYTGDLFQEGDEYWLNIRAQCDLSRKDRDTEKYNPLYCLKGEVLNTQDVTTDYVKITAENKLEIDKNKAYELSSIINCNNSMRNSINNKLRKYRDNIFFRKGNFLERGDSVIIGCVAGGKILKFGLEIHIKHFDCVKELRIGRVLPPYITRIQQKCAHNMIREGVLPIPESLFD